MLYRPNKKETKQIKELNKAYNLFRKAFDIILKNVPRKDQEIDTYIYRVGQNIDNLLRRVAKLLEAQYVDKEFFNIIKNLNNKDKK